MLLFVSVCESFSYKRDCKLIYERFFEKTSTWISGEAKKLFTQNFPHLLHFFFNWRIFLYNVMTVSVVQQCESAMSTHLSPSSWASLLPHTWFLRWFVKPKCLRFWKVQKTYKQNIAAYFNNCMNRYYRSHSFQLVGMHTETQREL